VFFPSRTTTYEKMNIQIPSAVTKAINRGILHKPNDNDSRKLGVILASGAGGGLWGPSGMYTALASKYADNGIAALQIDYRHPNHTHHCVQDIYDGMSLMEQTCGVSEFVLVGWSFGGSVVITAGSSHTKVSGVATLASQTAGTDGVSKLGPKKPILLLHGTDDTCLSHRCSKSLYESAKDPKELVLYKGDNHGFTVNHKLAAEKIYTWTVENFL
jgi:dienelactone hydrolase